MKRLGLLGVAVLALLTLSAQSGWAQKRGRTSFSPSSRPSLRSAPHRSFAPSAFRRAGLPAPEGPQPQNGALIRTAGMLPRVASGGPFATHSVESGSHFMNTTAGYRGEVLTGAGVSWGPPDRQPSGNSKAGGNGISIRNDTTIPGQ